jgi:hypothetical protein
MIDINHPVTPAPQTAGIIDATTHDEFPDIFRYESLDSQQLAERLNLPESWIRDQVRSRAEDPMPHAQFGKYVRFLWGSPELEAWLRRRIIVPNNKRVGRVH